MKNIIKGEREKQIKEIFKELQYYKLELIYKDGLYRFYIKNKQGKLVRLLRSFHDNNFNIESDFYSNSSNKINKIKSDYNYILNSRSDC